VGTIAVFVIRFISSRFPVPSDGEVARGEVTPSDAREE
jgi:hypothetical protein